MKPNDKDIVEYGGRVDVLVQDRLLQSVEASTFGMKIGVIESKRQTNR
jgi:hypothetical protein